jgi:hypothetical protein
MGSDRARVTYDPSRQYRAVVAQQGRVTVEADQNEAWTIQGERERATVLDLVGGSGTPDNGYEVSPAAPPLDVKVGAGTMYVGGMRVELPEAVWYSGQSEWLDRDGDPDWVDPKVPRPQNSPPYELVLLELTEHEVSATEDSALREVALGGPDTAQRTRLVQRIKLLGTSAGTCDQAMAAAAWTGGRTFSPTTMRLESSARLQVGFASQGPPPDDCDPAAVDGYLGAENQLIRVQVTASGTLLWGYDDASFLYRVDVTNNSPVVSLRSRPPDAFHQPRKGQAVELLRSAARLTDTDFVAASVGHVFTVAEAYDPDHQSVELSAPPDLVYSQTPQAFLRVWEQELTLASGMAVTLGATGLTVTPTGQSFHAGDYWLFAVRPATPQVVYPDRYLTAQPPDGPRTWICPLAVMQVKSAIGGLELAEDCRCRFDGLCELTGRGGGCCAVVVRPADAGTLQAVIDGITGPTTICLSPGTYVLLQPLRIGPQIKNLTIEGRNGGVQLRAAAGQEQHFLHGLIVVDGAGGVTFRGLEFVLSEASFEAGFTHAGQLASDAAAGAPAPQLSGPVMMVGIRPIQCSDLAVIDCTFQFHVPDVNVVGAGILASGAMPGLRLHGSQFVLVSGSVGATDQWYRVLTGLLLASSVEWTSNPQLILPAQLDQASIRDCTFDGMEAAVLALATLGSVRIENNTVVRSNAGFLLVSPGWLDFIALQSKITVPDTQASLAPPLQRLLLAIVLDPAVQIAGAVARLLPLPAGSSAPTVPYDGTKANTAWNHVQNGVQALFDQLFAQGVPPTAKRDHLSDETASVASLFAPSGALASLAQLSAAVSAIEAASLVAMESSPFLSLASSGNDVQVQPTVTTVTKGATPESSAAFAVLDRFGETDPAQATRPAQATITGERWRNKSLVAPTAAVVLVQYGAVSGNVVLNDAPDNGTSLAVLPFGADSGQLVAVAGNTFSGGSVLPPRRAGLTWGDLNAQA